MRARTWAVVLGLMTLAACGDPVAETTTTSVGAGPTTTSTAEPDSGGVSTADTPLGTILVDPDGLTLYVFVPDNGGESTCHGDCAVIWPPVPGDTPIGSGVDASIFGTTTRGDGTEQLTVDGWPLYLFASDSGPGDVNGQAIEGVWFVVDAGGEMIGAAEASGDSTSGSDSTDPGSDYDYGY